MTTPAVPPLVELLQFLVSSVVSRPEAIRISRVETPKTDLFYLEVAQDDLGRLLGREGKTVESIRVMVDVAATQYGKSAIVDVIEPPRKSRAAVKRDKPPRGRRRRPRRRRSGRGTRPASKTASKSAPKTK